MTLSRRLVVKSGSLALLGFGSGMAGRALAQTHYYTPDPIWLEHGDHTSQDVDHSLFAYFLKRYLIKQTPTDILRVQYEAALKDQAALKALNDYIQLLSDTRVDLLSPRQQLAFWANLYNALTIKLVLDHYPVESIRDIGGFFSGPWTKPLIRIFDHELSLDDIEHRIIRAGWRDPLIHYILNCGSYSCPQIPSQPLTGNTVYLEMEQRARAYVNHPRAVEVYETGKLKVSSIYYWYEDDFEADGGVIVHISKYAEPKLREQLKEISKFDKHSYDWSLNDVSL